jgi:hypothetical protein
LRRGLFQSGTVDHAQAISGFAQRSLSTSRVKPICILLIALFPSFSPLSKFSRNRLCQPTTIDTRHRGPVGVPTRTINMEVL